MKKKEITMTSYISHIRLFIILSTSIISNIFSFESLSEASNKEFCQNRIAGIQRVLNDSLEQKLKATDPKLHPYYKSLYPDLANKGINALNIYKQNILYLFLENPKIPLRLIEDLILCGINVNQMSNRNITPLGVAAMTYNIPAMQLLIDKNAQINLDNTGTSPRNLLLDKYIRLSLDERGAQEETVYQALKFLFDHGATVDYKTIDKFANSPNASRRISDLIYQYAPRQLQKYKDKRPAQQTAKRQRT